MERCHLPAAVRGVRVGRLLQRRYRRSRREGSGQGLGHGRACPERSEFAYTKDPGSEKCMSRDKAEIDNGQVRAYAPKMSTLVISNFKMAAALRRLQGPAYKHHQGRAHQVGYARDHELRTRHRRELCQRHGAWYASHRHPLHGWRRQSGEPHAHRRRLGRNGRRREVLADSNSWGDTWKDNGRIKIDRGNNGSHRRTLR